MNDYVVFFTPIDFLSAFLSITMKIMLKSPIIILASFISPFTSISFVSYRQHPVGSCFLLIFKPCLIISAFYLEHVEHLHLMYQYGTFKWNICSFFYYLPALCCLFSLSLPPLGLMGTFVLRLISTLGLFSNPLCTELVALRFTKFIFIFSQFVFR